jgi:PilZ domain.
MSAINAGDIERLQDVSPDWLNTLKTLTHVALVQDVTHTESKDSYLSHPKPSLSSQALRRFLHQRNPVCAAQLISSDRQPQRREPRYAYRSEVSLVHPEQGALKGRLVDFSSGGLNLKLAQPFQGAKDDLVSVSLDAFVNIDPRAPLSICRIR